MRCAGTTKCLRPDVKKAEGDVPPRHCVPSRAQVRPRAVPWFGIRSFYGHLWHLVASAIATQDIDSRDWMHADSPAALTKNIARVLEAASRRRASVTEALGRDVFIDYVADTGDDPR